MKPLFRFFASKPLISHLLVVMVLMLGAHSYLQINRTLFPLINTGELGIYTYYPGAAPEDVEINITNRIEKELKGVPGIKRVTSTSVEGASSIHVVMDESAGDLAVSVSAVREAVGRITDLPGEVAQDPRILEFKTSEMPIIEVAVVGDIPYGELREIAKVLEDEVSAIHGVGGMKAFGFQARQVEVALSPKALTSYQIAMFDVIRAIQRRNIRSSGGTFESFTSEKSVVTMAQFREPLEVEEVIVRSTFDGPKIRVRDLAVVRENFKEPTIINRLNGLHAISFQIRKSENADILSTVDAIHAKLAELRKTLPEGVELQAVADLSRFVKNRFTVVQDNGWMGLLLVIGVLTIFLNLQTAFWVALGIPVCLAGVFIMLGAMNYELDVVALSGFIIILGILVDDAIIVAENIYHRFEMGDDPIDAAVNGLSEVFKPVMTTIFTTFLAFAPMFFIPGIMGRFVFVIPLVITMALIASTFELIIALPAHLVPALERRQKKARQNPNAPTRNWFDPLRKLCRIVVKFSLRFRYVVLVLCVALASGWFWYAHHFMEVILFPNSAADEFHVMMELPMGSSLEASSEKVKELEKVVATIPDDEISAYVTRAGRWGVDFAVDGERYATVQVILTPFAQRTRTVNDIIADLRAETDKIEGITKLVFHIKSGGPPIGPPVMIRVVSPHDAMRNLLTQDLVTFLNGLPGVHDVDNDVRPGKKQVQIQLNYNRLAELGLTAADVAQNVRIAYDGQLVTSARYGDEDVDFRVILQDEARRDTQYLEKLLIPNQQGRLIPLQRIANLEISEGIAAYHHYRFKRSTTIKANVDTAETTPIDVLNAVREHFNVTQDYPGARLVMEGEAVETEQSMSDLLITMLTAVIGIYFLLIILFDSAVQPILVMITIPFGAAAVIHTFAMHDEPIGFLALLGLVGLSGVVVNDSLVLVSHINEMRKKHRGDRLLNIIAAGTADRLRAIVMTTITTVVGLIPLAYGWGGSDPFMAPMALAMGYGLLLVTPLTLVLVPCLYTVALDIQFFGEWIKGKVFGNPEETETS